MSLRKAGGFILDLLFPKRCPFCGTVLGFAAGCGCVAGLEAIGLATPPLPPPALDEAHACYTYEEPLRGAILRMKFEDEPELAAPLGDMLAQLCLRAGMQARYDCVVPAPASAKTLRHRGYNQSALLARRVAAGTGLECDERLLAKVVHTQPQHQLDAKARLVNLEGAFAADSRAEGRRVLLVDDIMTTGSTLNECAKALKQAGAVCCGALCLAYTPPPNQG